VNQAVRDKHRALVLAAWPGDRSAGRLACARLKGRATRRWL